jgi:hypothetical protein
MKDLVTAKYERAKKRVNCIKGFYNHLAAFLIVNLLILLFRFEFIPVITFSNEDPNLQHWLDWNTYGITLVWGFGLFVHGVWVFAKKWTFLQSWEEKKVQDIIEKEEKESKQRWS